MPRYSQKYGWRPSTSSSKTQKRNCARCGRKFNSTSPRHKRCRRCRNTCITCGAKSEPIICKVCLHKDDPIIGCYVYGWYKPGERLPFYVGKGTGDRAWRKCQFERKVKIYRSNLTEEGAYLVESVLIGLFRELGAVLLNRAKGVQRQEKVPLNMSL